MTDDVEEEGAEGTAKSPGSAGTPEIPPAPRDPDDPAPRSSWCLAQLPWPEAGRALAHSPRLLLPVGALVQHGPHLPLGANTIIAEEVAREVAGRAGIPLAPTFSYGVRGPDRERFAGSAGLTRKTLHRAMNELLADWEDHGVREFVVVTAHRHEPHLDALLMAMTSSATLTVVNLFALDVSDLLDQAPRLEHGGELETSLLLHLRPSWVRWDEVAGISQLPDSRRYASLGAPTPPSGSRGILGAPSRASAEKGRRVFQRYVTVLSELLADSAADGGSGGGVLRLDRPSRPRV